MPLKQGGLFQSTYPHGVRPGSTPGIYSWNGFQSTYPHGVRPSSGSWHSSGNDFNPRTRTGYDGWKRVYRSRVTLFQSTYPHGVRLIVADGTTGDTLFQSTYPHGVRRCSRARRRNRYRFQSTYPHGVRLFFPYRLSPHKDFNPRTRTGYDGSSGRLSRRTGNFNPRTRTGYDIKPTGRPKPN